MNSLYTLALACAACTGMASANADVQSVPKESAQMTHSNGQLQPPVSYATLWADENGATHVGHCRLEGLEFKSYAPPAAPQWVGVSPDDIESIAYAVLPVGYVGNWHHVPGPQWVITLQGQWSVETTDGSVLVQGPGEMQFNADTRSRPRPDDERVGHLTRTVGDQPNVQLIIKLKPSAADKRTNGSCAY
ncbi:hypothetical protein EIG75_15270 [Pseudomonas syringae]|uniref:Cupin n=1 Tax=Pseudomonas syringae TaxID=317 RepID=A0A6B2AZQ6_PSESX|nr:hypothetical protein [Pseudomonas syringae]MBI6562309.1 hypothetical protein [Pseudomonas syringae]MBI6572685.1 hypothetical protein [Pseudomonas syringae]MBI6586907.1 hypothetical protein [Pseudomonas syringae]MBI6593191.1 hypothetical protein [Pseudomonas syringae]MDC6489626.1 hypothetical protein [Pseudomonas syringae]